LSVDRQGIGYDPGGSLPSAKCRRIKQKRRRKAKLLFEFLVFANPLALKSLPTFPQLWPCFSKMAEMAFFVGRIEAFEDQAARVHLQRSSRRGVAPKWLRFADRGFHVGRPPKGVGFGFGGEVVLSAVDGRLRKPDGSYGWDGAFGTYWWVNRKEQMAAIFFIQTPGRAIHQDFDNAVSQAIID
jgi:hypothetical protein